MSFVIEVHQNAIDFCAKFRLFLIREMFNVLQNAQKKISVHIVIGSKRKIILLHSILRWGFNDQHLIDVDAKGLWWEGHKVIGIDHGA